MNNWKDNIFDETKETLNENGFLSYVDEEKASEILREINEKLEELDFHLLEEGYELVFTPREVERHKWHPSNRKDKPFLAFNHNSSLSVYKTYVRCL